MKLLLAFKISDKGNRGQKQSTTGLLSFHALFSSAGLPQGKLNPATVPKMLKTDGFHQNQTAQAAILYSF